ncbi:MAG: glycosyltransferase [bacterium]
MTVLYSCLSLSWGGMEMFTIQAVQQLLKRGIHTELLCYAGSKIEIEAKRQNIITFRSQFSGYFNLSETIKVSRLLKSKNYSLVHTQASKDLWLLVPALKLADLDIPLFLTKQVGSFVIKKDFLHKWLYKRLNAAFAISTVINNNLLNTTTLKQDKVLMLHNGTDTNRFNPEKIDREKERLQLGLKDTDIVIGMLARFSSGKGHIDLIEAAKILIQKYDNLKFLLVGEPSRGETEFADKIKQMVIDYNLTKEFIFTGFRKDTENVISAMDIFAFPSHAEAFGIALVEAMSMAKPSVCSNSDGILDIAIDGQTSYLFTNHNSRQLAEKLELLILSEETRINFGNNARRRAVEYFDIEYLTDKVINYYKDFVKD